MTETAVAGFLDELTAAVTPLDRRWVAAFAEVPRGVFVPYFFDQQPPDWQWRLVEAPDPAWLAGILSLRPLVVQLDGDAAAERARRQPTAGTPTSSSSAPGLMAAMLQALDVHEGDRVLEVGTGTGYNAALLCHRLGGDHVTSVDIDSALVETARARLDAIGHRPYLAAVDGAQGVPAQGPFDKVIATVALPRLPRPWQQQMNPGGTILLPLDLAAHGGLIARLDVDRSGAARGRFLSSHGYFMAVRDRQLPSPPFGADGAERVTALPAERVRPGRDAFDAFAALRTGGFGWAEFTPDNGDAREIWLAHRDGSWVCHTTHSTHMRVRQGGPRQLWDEVESAFDQWEILGQPDHDRFGLTVTPDGLHQVWLDHPEGSHRWDLLH